MDADSARHPGDQLLYPVLDLDCDSAACGDQSLIHFVCRYKGKLSLNTDERNKQIDFAARLVEECLLMQREYRSWCTFELRHCLGGIMPWFVGKRYGNLLTIGYLVLKVLFVALPIAQIWFMSRYIGLL